VKWTPLRRLNGYVVLRNGAVVDSTFSRYKSDCLSKARAGFPAWLLKPWDLAEAHGLRLAHAQLVVGPQATHRHGNTGRKRKRPASKGGE